MATQKTSKVNLLMRRLRPNEPVSAAWLRREGYSSALVALYVRKGWLTSPTRSVYLRAGGEADWPGVVRTLQQGEALRLHPGGRFALATQGFEHYLSLGGAPVIGLYGEDRPPRWVSSVPLKEKMEWHGRSPFALAVPTLADDTSDDDLHAHGLTRVETNTSGSTVVMSTAERAVLESCAEKADTALVLELDAIVQGMTNLRPSLVQALLENCSSVQAKRLFLALAERHAHAWLDRLSLDKVNLGTGKRSLVRGGRLDPKYQITLPTELDNALG